MVTNVEGILTIGGGLLCNQFVLTSRRLLTTVPYILSERQLVGDGTINALC